MLQTKEEIVRDGVFIGSEFNETNTSPSKNFRDLGLKERDNA